ncbi:MAG: tetratricopeptide repeat protein, partial [Magnetococcales bacterium]|nr:tetratricopeptide repeat protein [Magnetococcales bacterium]
FIQDPQGRPVLAPLVSDALIALAGIGHGVFTALTPDDRDLETLAASLMHGGTLGPAHLSQATTEVWDEKSPWLLLLLLPVAAMAFRRGWLLGLSCMVCMMTAPPALALSWDDLWLRPDQQAKKALEAGDAARAAQLFQDSGWRGMAQSQAGQEALASDSFAQWGGADGLYNRGNMLAHQRKLQEAIQAYDQALTLKPDMADAKANRQLVEKLLQKEQQQQQQQNNSSTSNAQNGQEEKKGAEEQSPAEKPAANTPAEEKSNPATSHSASPPVGKDPNQAKHSPAAPNSQEENPNQTKHSPAAPNSQEENPNQAKHSPAAPNSQEEKKEAEQQSPAGKQAANTSADEKSTPATSDSASPPAGKEPDRTPNSPAAQTPAGQEAARVAEASPLDAENRQAMEQWLQRIPDDPGGLLRRKFLLEQRRRGRPAEVTSPW